MQSKKKGLKKSGRNRNLVEVVDEKDDSVLGSRQSRSHFKQQRYTHISEGREQGERKEG